MEFRSALLAALATQRHILLEVTIKDSPLSSAADPTAADRTASSIASRSRIAAVDGIGRSRGRRTQSNSVTLGSYVRDTISMMVKGWLAVSHLCCTPSTAPEELCTPSATRSAS